MTSPDNAPPRSGKVDVLYSVEDRPPWYLCLLLGFQHFLTAFGATFAFPVLIQGALCMAGDQVGLGQMISTVTFVSGLSTLLQVTFGVRLPIIQSVSYSFVTPIFVVLGVNSANCPFNYVNANATLLPKLGSDEHREIWQDNLRELQGCLMLASLLSILVGFSGIVGVLMRFIGPLTVAPTITLIALSLFESASLKASGQWYICFMTIFLVALFSQYLREWSIPCPCLKDGIKIFALFPVLLAVIVSWLVCLIFTETDVFTNNPTKWGYSARTDTQKDVLADSDWFRFPYPGQWGVPKLSLAGVLGMLAALLASIIESVGDYYACARLAGAPPPPASAINRGIGVEGITCLLAGAWGAGGGNTSYSENIGAIGITKVGSRVVVQVAALIMLVLGCLGKFGALFVTIPEPVVAGLFFVMFGMVGAVGISNLQFVDLNSSRNLFVFGVSLFFGLSVPSWVNQHPGAINTGDSNADQVLRVLCGTNMFVGGALAFLMDNTVPGTLKERGIIAWTSGGDPEHDTDGADLSMYDIPYIQPWLNKLAVIKYIPVCPGFVFDRKSSKADASPQDIDLEDVAALDGQGETNQGFQAEKTPVESEKGFDSRL